MTGKGTAVARFTTERPSTDSHWRALILFGRNVASYKFALGHTLLELGAEGRERASLEDLAAPFSRHLCRHLQAADRQGTSSQSKFLDACRARNRDEISDSDLIDTTARLGFNNVIDAFHILDGATIEERFFVDERSSGGGIRLTDRVLDLANGSTCEPLTVETEARWALVEAAWGLNLPRQLLTVAYDPADGLLRASGLGRRRASIAHARHALNGYQKGVCFYCFQEISVDAASPLLGQVDHVFPWSFGESVAGAPIDGAWNLVVACARCNGWGEKSNRPPHLRYVERLSRRNDFLIASQHPLRPTLIEQTGPTQALRNATLQRAYDEVTVGGVRKTWEAPEELTPTF